MTYDPAAPIDIRTWTEREQLAAVLIRDRYGVDDDTIVFYRSRYCAGNGRDYWRDALETADAILAAGFTYAPVAKEWLHVRRADGMDLCEYDDEDWPCAAERQRLADNPENEYVEDALDAVLDVIRDSIEDAAYGLEVETSETGLVVSWPLDTDHPQPPGVPLRVRITATDEDSA